ncbi:adhesion G-protein coupled receptor G2-like [Megalops cyprinoides]|uniref:adhesion G-protein coupled receptor G2-like n=1 Tax=Megalops cyprinoides TaxID=118141 RepID=UPI0018643930|nr:adhesion G-protein coupled receptor G2-like [Megalops cyprinoides]
MTPFAVLLVPAKNIDKDTWKILSIISYIGSGLSAFFTAISILTYFIIRSPSRDHSVTIHVSLSGALYLLNLSLLLNEWLASMQVRALCLFIATMMHYSLLCSFTWMAIEALHLYLLIIRVFNTYFRHYIAKLSAVGWGIPAVIVGVSIATTYKSNQFYGPVELNLENSTSSLCWIMDVHFFYGLNVSYFCIVFLFNNGILLTVSARICQLRKFGRKSAMMVPWKDTCTVLGLTCLLGTTWGLAFLSYGVLTIPVLYLFSIFNSLQGFLIFLWICGTARKEKRNAALATSAGTLVSTVKPK